MKQLGMVAAQLPRAKGVAKCIEGDFKFVNIFMPIATFKGAETQWDASGNSPTAQLSLVIVVSTGIQDPKHCSPFCVKVLTRCKL